MKIAALKKSLFGGIRGKYRSEKAVREQIIYRVRELVYQPEDDTCRKIVRQSILRFFLFLFILYDDLVIHFTSSFLRF